MTIESDSDMPIDVFDNEYELQLAAAQIPPTAPIDVEDDFEPFLESLAIV